MRQCIHREFADPNKGWMWPDPNTVPVGTEWECPGCGMKFVVVASWDVVTDD